MNEISHCCKFKDKIMNIHHPNRYWDMKSRTMEYILILKQIRKLDQKFLCYNIILMKIYMEYHHGRNENIKYHYHDEKM